jgi:hypothetical protein
MRQKTYRVLYSSQLSVSLTCRQIPVDRSLHRIATRHLCTHTHAQCYSSRNGKASVQWTHVQTLQNSMVLPDPPPQNVCITYQRTTLMLRQPTSALLDQVCSNADGPQMAGLRIPLTSRGTIDTQFALSAAPVTSTVAED